MERNETEHSWERFLDPEVLKPALFMATMFITSYEILKDSIVGRIRDFLTESWDADGSEASQTYREEVLADHKSPIKGSLAWLRKHGVLEDADLETFKALTETRNTLAHELISVVTGSVTCDYERQFETLIALLRKIEVWWIVNVELAVDPNYADKEIDEAGIVPGPIISLLILIEVAGGSTALLEKWRATKADAA